MHACIFSTKSLLSCCTHADSPRSFSCVTVCGCFCHIKTCHVLCSPFKFTPLSPFCFFFLFLASFYHPLIRNNCRISLPSCLQRVLFHLSLWLIPDLPPLAARFCWKTKNNWWLFDWPWPLQRLWGLWSKSESIWSIHPSAWKSVGLCLVQTRIAPLSTLTSPPREHGPPSGSAAHVSCRRHKCCQLPNFLQYDSTSKIIGRHSLQNAQSQTNCYWTKWLQFVHGEKVVRDKLAAVKFNRAYLCVQHSRHYSMPLFPRRRVTLPQAL